MPIPEIHRLVRRSDLAGLTHLLDTGRADIDVVDASGMTPLMRAAHDSRVDPAVLSLLLGRGARVDLEYREEFDLGFQFVRCTLGLALRSGHPAKVRALLDAGVSLRPVTIYEDDLLLVGTHGREIRRDPHLLDLIRLLIERGANLSRNRQGCSALGDLSRAGRLDAVALLLDAGADERLLRWTPLLRGAALGSLADVERLAREGASLEDRDRWSRTPWLLAILAGDLAKVQLLRGLGADVDARGELQESSLACAIQGHHPDVLRWLLKTGQQVDQADEMGRTPLMIAVELDDLECVRTLLDAGADVHREDNFQDGPMLLARSAAVVRLLIERGADLARLSPESRRALLGLSPEPDVGELDIPAEAFLRARTPRFGTGNPETIDEPFWTAMIRAGATGWEATRVFDGPSSFLGTPVWCASRFGQSITLLPDGRIVQIGGEHEDYYDPDFYIYNDVFVHEPDGTIRIYGYPASTFPPTDSHSATLIGTQIYVIGSIGYGDQRRHGTTPVYRLDTETFTFEWIECTGKPPGWIHKHRATLVSAHEIQVTHGIVLEPGQDLRDEEIENGGVFVLDTRTREWRSL